MLKILDTQHDRDENQCNFHPLCCNLLPRRTCGRSYVMSDVTIL